MRWANRFLLFVPTAFLALLLFRSGFATAERNQEDPMRSFAQLKRGMSPEQVRHTVGSPKHVARQILYHRYREQWVYEIPAPVRLTFDCPRGQLPQLLSLPSFLNEPDGRQPGDKNR